MINIKLQRVDKGWNVPIKNWHVTVMVDDYAMELMLEHNSAFVNVRIESQYTFSNSDGDKSIHKPNQLFSSHIDRFLTINELIVFDTGELKMVFSDQTILYVERSEDYEPWQISSSGGMKIVSVPGGDLSVWQ